MYLGDLKKVKDKTLEIYSIDLKKEKFTFLKKKL